MNRRKLFGFLAAAPLAAAAVREAVTEVAAQPTVPVGFMRISYETKPIYLQHVVDPGHTHTHALHPLEIPSHSHTITPGRPAHPYGTYAYWAQSTEAVPFQEIYDGKQFVRLNSPEGVAVFNDLMGRRA